MTVADLSALGKFSEEASQPKPEEPTGLTEITWEGRILSIDQAISRTGWADMVFKDSSIIVVDTGVITTTPDAGDIDDTLNRGIFVTKALRELMEGIPCYLVVHEMPVAGPRKTRNREAGPIAAMAVRCAAEQAGVKVIMQNVQHVRSVLGLPRGADKKDTRKMVKRYIPGIDQRSELKLNDDTYDAMGQGIVTAIEQSNR